MSSTAHSASPSSLVYTHSGDFLVWHGDELRRRRPHNRLKKLVGSIRKGKAANDQGKLAFRRTETSAPAEPAVEVNQESPKKKGLFRRISKKSKE